MKLSLVLGLLATQSLAMVAERGRRSSLAVADVSDIKLPMYLDNKVTERVRRQQVDSVLDDPAGGSSILAFEDDTEPSTLQAVAKERPDDSITPLAMYIALFMKYRDNGDQSAVSEAVYVSSIWKTTVLRNMESWSHNNYRAYEQGDRQVVVTNVHVADTKSEAQASLHAARQILATHTSGVKDWPPPRPRRDQ